MAFALLLGLAGGAAVSAAIERVTRGKRGKVMQLSVVATVGLRLLFGRNIALFDRDVGGALAAVAGAAYAWNRLC